MSELSLTAHAMGYGQADKRLEILRLVRSEGSISQAARCAGVSYKAAWQAIHTLTNLTGTLLVDGSVGGAGGGGAHLTPAGERLLLAADRLGQARQQVLARLNANDDVQTALRAPQTSMRNQLRCVVADLQSDGAGDPMVRVSLRVGKVDTMDASLTRESSELLALVPNMPILALCKATAVHVAPPASALDGVGSRLPGRVLEVARGHGQDEFVLELADGQRLVGFASKPNRLRRGSRALAQVASRAVVLM